MTLIGLDSGTDRLTTHTLTVGSGTGLALQDDAHHGRQDAVVPRGQKYPDAAGPGKSSSAAPTRQQRLPDRRLRRQSGHQRHRRHSSCGRWSTTRPSWARKSKISIEDCTLTLLKSDKLGPTAARFCANGADNDADGRQLLRPDGQRQRRGPLRRDNHGDGRHAVRGGGKVRPRRARLRVADKLRPLCLRPQRQQRKDRLADHWC